MAPAQIYHTEIDLAAKQIVVDGYVVQIDAKTVIHMRGSEISIADLNIGMTVKVKGPLKEGILYARRITVKNC